jgi:uridylate kinase
MKKEVIVISLGGSLIIPDKVNVRFLRDFKKVINNNIKKYKFVVECGGGSIARKYISALRDCNLNRKLQSLSGISATRMNARFMNYFFGINPKKGIPRKMKNIKKYLKKQEILFCGALRYKPNQTSDTTAAEIAKKFNTNLINITNVKGLYDKNPKKYKNAKLIKKISWKNFDEIVNKIPFKPGQHFVLDSSASKIILKNQIPTYIIGSVKELDNILKNKNFNGTIIKN